MAWRISPRDGLQSEAVQLSTAQEIALIERAVIAGVRRIEAASFVRADRVPQMADAEAVIAGLDLGADVVTIGLVMNERGLDRALRTRVGEIGAVCVASDSFARANQGQTAAQSIRIAAAIVRAARVAGRRARATIGAAFGCPFERGRSGASDRRGAEIAAAGPVEIARADTIGVAVPAEVATMVEVVGNVTGLPVRVHLHDTRHSDIANAWAAIGAGASTLDASLSHVHVFHPGQEPNEAAICLVLESAPPRR